MAGVTRVIGKTPLAPSDPTKQGRTIEATPFRIRPLGDRTKYLKMLIYGRHGAGKTTFAGTAADVPEMQNVLLANAESGQMALEDSPLIQQPEHIYDTGPLTDFYQAANVLQNFLRPHCRFRDAGDEVSLKKLQSAFFGQPLDEIEEPVIFRTVVVDSIREIEIYCLYRLLGIDMNKTDFKLDAAEQMDVPEWAEYKKNNQMTQILLRGFRDLPMHVIMCCPAKYTQDERKVFHWTPQLTGQLAGQVQGFVDIVGYLISGVSAEGPANRRMYIQQAGNVEGVGRFDAKNRKAILDDVYLDNPTLPSLMQQLNMTKGVAE